MSRIDETEAGGKNICAFLDMIAHSELGKKLLALSDDGYNVVVGSTPDHPMLFVNYADHPRKMMAITIKGNVIHSSAAGRYQILMRYWDAYRKQLNLTGFTPENQDRVAIQQLKETHAYSLIQAGKFEDAIARCKNIWASLPGASYGQHENKLSDLQLAYVAAGGGLA